MKIPKAYKNQPWRLWFFVIGLNMVGFLGLIFLKTQGIDLYSFRSGG